MGVSRFFSIIQTFKYSTMDPDTSLPLTVYVFLIFCFALKVDWYIFPHTSE